MTATLDPLQIDAARELAYHSLPDAIPYFRSKYQIPHHLKPLLDVFQRAIDVGGVRAVVSVPPQNGKSETGVAAAASYLWHHPERTVAYASYSSDLAESKALKIQDICTNRNLVRPGKMQNRTEWRTLEEGGILATGVLGGLTGQSVHLMLIDDPLKNREEAESPTRRDLIWGWFEDVVETRYQPETSIIIWQTRWHEEDLAGKIAKHRPEFELIRIPALEDGLDFFGKDPVETSRAIGAPLWPERQTLKDLEDIRRKKPFTFSALYQGLPRARGSKLFEANLLRYRELPYALERTAGLDLAYTAQKHNDSCSFVLLGFVGEFCYVLRAWKWRSGILETTERLQEYQRRYGLKPRTEDNGPQKAVNDTLEDKGIELDRYQPTVDKYARAQDLAEAWASQRIFVPDLEMYPEAAEWLPAWLEEMEAFTGIADSADDQVDATVNAFNQKPVEDNDPNRNLTPDRKFTSPDQARKRLGGY